MATTYKALIFKNHPHGVPIIGTDLAVETRSIDLNNPQLAPGSLLLKVHYVSFDPYQRNRMQAPGNNSYWRRFQIDHAIVNRGIGTVIAVGKSDSKEAARWKVGDVLIVSNLGTEEYSVVPESVASDLVLARRLENPLHLSPETFIGALGMSGLTAYASLYEIGHPKKGETLFVSSASGAVGALVGQLAKREGMKVVGSVGDDEKLKYLTEELGFDGGFNYKTEKVEHALQRLVPDGIDVYYDNVGGEQLEAALEHMNLYGRVVCCGMISQYNTKPEECYGVKNLMQMFGKSLTMRGFIVGDHNMGPRYFKEHQENVSKWIKDGSLRAKSSITKGIDNAAEGFVGMLQGRNFGKALVEICPLE